MLCKSILMLASIGSCLAQSPLVSSVGNFIHNVADLDRSVHFYRDVLGMELQRPPGDWQTGEPVLNLYNAAGGKYRVTSAQIPGSPMRAELAEFQGVDRKPVRRPWGTAGNSVLMLTVANLSSIEARLTTSNVPMLVKPKKACNGQGLIVADPDGFPVMLVQHNTSADPAPPTKSNFTGMRFGYLVADDAMQKGPFAALALAATAPPEKCRSIETTLLGSSPSIVTIPGGFEVWLAKGKATKEPKRAVSPHDPGAAVLRLVVTDIDAAVQALGQAGVKVVSAGGAIQTLSPAAARATILQAPDDLLIQVLK